MNKAVFLDRDGTLTVEKGYVCRLQELDIFSYSRECVSTIHKKGYLAIVITNQSGVARGLFSERELRLMNERLIEETGVDGLYYCPHHPHGIIEDYSFECECRKPHTDLVDRACKDYDITVNGSYMVGDRASDIILGENAGLITVLLESGYGSVQLEEHVTPDFIYTDLRGFVNSLI